MELFDKPPCILHDSRQADKESMASVPPTVVLPTGLAPPSKCLSSLRARTVAVHVAGSSWAQHAPEAVVAFTRCLPPLHVPGLVSVGNRKAC